MQDPEHQRGKSPAEQGPADPDPPSDEVAQPTREEVAGEICRDILAIHRNSYGRGAGNAQAHIVGDTVIVILDELELLPHEEFLIANGQEGAVASVRDQFQNAIGSTFKAAVERSTGRRVIGFASHVQLEEPRFSVEIFRLERR